MADLAYRQSLNEQLQAKVEQEYAAFKEETLAKPSQEIWQAAYEITLKHDIATCISQGEFTPKEVKALLKSPNILAEVYDEWLYSDYSHMEDLQAVAGAFTDRVAKAEKTLSISRR